MYCWLFVYTEKSWSCRSSLKIVEMRGFQLFVLDISIQSDFLTLSFLRHEHFIQTWKLLIALNRRMFKEHGIGIWTKQSWTIESLLRNLIKRKLEWSVFLEYPPKEVLFSSVSFIFIDLDHIELLNKLRNSRVYIMGVKITVIGEKCPVQSQVFK